MKKFIGILILLLVVAAFAQRLELLEELLREQLEELLRELLEFEVQLELLGFNVELDQLILTILPIVAMPLNAPAETL